MNKYWVVLIFICLLINVSCIKKEPANEKKPDNLPLEHKQVETLPSAESTESKELPFSLIIGGTIVGPELRVNIAEGQGTLIKVMSNSVETGQMKVIHPEGDSLILGSWQAGVVQLYHEFPYGENRLIITLGEKEYEVLVVAGAPSPGQTKSYECYSAYLKLSYDATWNYEESLPDTTIYWKHSIKNLSQNSSGELTATVLAEGIRGNETKVSRTSLIDLVCKGDQLYITRMTDTFEDHKMVISYDAGTICIPPKLEKGVMWKRHGVALYTEGDGEALTYDVEETFTCVGEEPVSVKAGDFTASKVDFKIIRKGNDEEFTSEGSIWYVLGLGRVLSQSYSDSSLKLELVSFDGISPSIGAE